MTGIKKPALCSHHDEHISPSPYKSLYFNPLTDPSDKENAAPAPAADVDCCAGQCPTAACKGKPASFPAGIGAAQPRRAALRPTSLQLCMRVNEPDSPFAAAAAEGSKLWDPPSSSYEAWDLSDSEAAPASSWSTLPNRSLLCRPLPLDVGRCTCIIAREAAQGLKGIHLYSLYTNEGQGRQDRKLAVAWHRRRKGRSEFVVAQSASGVFCRSDENFLGTVTANLMGSKYQIWDQGKPAGPLRQSKRLLGVVAFEPTIKTWTGSFRSMRAWIPKHQSMLMKNTPQIQHINGLPKDWQEKKNKSHHLFSKVPYYNNVLKRNELDFRERGWKSGHRIQESVKNFHLTMEENGKQLILQFGRIGKAKYVMEYRYPLTGYQAFCICLGSIDSKLCCTV